MLRCHSLLMSFAACAVRSLVILLMAAGVSMPALAVSPDVVISQVYGGGGNSGATYKNDFIELFNKGSVPVSLSGWSVQYSSATGTTWQVTPLTGTLQPGQYYLVQEAIGAGGTAPDQGAQNGGNAFAQLLSDLGNSSKSADGAVNDLATGGGADLHDVVLSTQFESLAFDLAVQVRNRLVDVYSEVFRMQV